MPVRRIKVLCGLDNETSILLKKQLQKAAEEKEMELQIASRYRKEGVYQYLAEHADFRYVILQEILQTSSPYKAEDVALLTDERDIRVIIVLNKGHAGSRYMRILYAAGILDALYEEDARAENIVGLLAQGRTRKEARKYYGIEFPSDVERALQIVDEKKLKSFLEYIENGGPYQEIRDRYEFLASRMIAAENVCLMRQLPSEWDKILSDSELFRYYHDLIFPKRRKGLFRLLKKDKKILAPKDIKKESGAATKENVTFGEQELPDEAECEEKSEMPIRDANIFNCESMESGTRNIREGVSEEESLFDLFGEEEDFGIFHYIEQKPENVPYKNAEVERVVQSETQSAGIDAERTEKPPKERALAVILESGGLKPALMALAGIMLSLLLGFILLRKLYGEQEVPVIEEFPVSSEISNSLNDSLTRQKGEEGAEILPDNFSASEANNLVSDRREITDGRQETAEEDEPQAANGTGGDEAEDVGTKKEETDKQGDKGADGRRETSKPPENSETQKEKEEDETAAAPQQPASISEEAIRGPEVIITEERMEGSSNETSTEIVQESSESPAEPDMMLEQEYNGKIFSGDELAGVAAKLQEFGMQLYVITRENGEGSFTVEEIAEKCDPACSFLVSVNGDRVEMTEQ